MTTDGTPVGWAEWEAWQDSDDCKKALHMIGEDLVRMGIATDFLLVLSLQHLASCAFAAGLDVGLKKGQGAPGKTLSRTT